MGRWHGRRIKDFSGDIIRVHQDAGRVMHSRASDLEIARRRDDAHRRPSAFLHKQLLKDSGRSRVGMPDYPIVFQDGENSGADPHTPEKLPGLAVAGMGVAGLDDRQPGANVLNVAIAREAQDEKHLAPLQLDVIERALALWRNPGDKGLSPFLGIGSRGHHVAQGRAPVRRLRTQGSLFSPRVPSIWPRRRASARCISLDARARGELLSSSSMRPWGASAPLCSDLEELLTGRLPDPDAPRIAT